MAISLIRLVTVVGDIEELYLENIGLLRRQFERCAMICIGNFTRGAYQSGTTVENHQLPVAIRIAPKVLTARTPEKRFQPVVVLRPNVLGNMIADDVEHITQ